MSSCVTLKGGEYFFAPSISFLKAMPGQHGGALRKTRGSRFGMTMIISVYSLAAETVPWPHKALA